MCANLPHLAKLLKALGACLDSSAYHMRPPGLSLLTQMRVIIRF